MIGQFTSFIREHDLFSPAGQILLAVSGGIDSMVMWNLFESAGFRYSVAHCNFQLRGAESDEDEKFVREHAGRTGTQLFVRKFDTLEYARLKGISVEMAARELRYGWFEKVRSAGNFDFIATAHHTDDLLETFFINLVRKTGIKGLTGFREKSGRLIRPMLFTSRDEITAWAEKNGIRYRHDSSNDEVVFQRNIIRHAIIPKLEELNPAFRKNLAETIRNLRDTEDFYITETGKYIRKVTDSEGGNEEMVVSSLLKLSHPKQVLFEWMARYGFNPAAVEAVFDTLEKEPGRQFFSRTHRLVTGHNKLIITILPERESRRFYIEKNDIEIIEPVRLLLKREEATGFEIIRDPRVACLDAGLLTFPLIIRKWSPGAYFQPLGMTGFKKISDYFTDEKFSLPEKEETRIIYSADKVVWIIGQRIDNRFRVTPDTKEVLVIKWC